MMEEQINQTTDQKYMKDAFIVNCTITRSFPKQHFYKQHQAEIANAKQHPEAELLLFENYSHSSRKNNTTCSTK